jgi:NAD(P)-dependent dehydrogenase (short-subunit alcohol dehydrogenase family)
VRVNAVAPGAIANPRRPAVFAPQEGLPLGSGSADDIAAAVGFLVSDAARYIVGQTISVAGAGDLAVSKGWHR